MSDRGISIDRHNRGGWPSAPLARQAGIPTTAGGAQLIESEVPISSVILPT